MYQSQNTKIGTINISHYAVINIYSALGSFMFYGT